MPLELGMEVSNMGNKQSYGRERSFKKEKNPKVLNKVPENTPKIGKVMTESRLRKADPTEPNGDTGVTASLDFFAIWFEQLLDSWPFCHEIVTGLYGL